MPSPAIAIATSGSEELYDFVADPHEFTNLSGDPEMKAVKDGLAAWLPDENAPE